MILINIVMAIGVIKMYLITNSTFWELERKGGNFKTKKSKVLFWTIRGLILAFTILLAGNYINMMGFHIVISLLEYTARQEKNQIYRRGESFYIVLMICFFLILIRI